MKLFKNTYSAVFEFVEPFEPRKGHGRGLFKTWNNSRKYGMLCHKWSRLVLASGCIYYTMGTVHSYVQNCILFSFVLLFI